MRLLRIFMFLLVSMPITGMMHEGYHVLTLGVSDVRNEACFFGYSYASTANIMGFMLPAGGWAYVSIPPIYDDIVVVNEIGAYAMTILGVILTMFLFKKCFPIERMEHK